MGVWAGGVALFDASYGTAIRDLLNLKCANEELEGGVGVILQRGEFLVFWGDATGARGRHGKRGRLRSEAAGGVNSGDSDAAGEVETPRTFSSS